MCIRDRFGRLWASKVCCDVAFLILNCLEMGWGVTPSLIVFARHWPLSSYNFSAEQEHVSPPCAFHTNDYAMASCYMHPGLWDTEDIFSRWAVCGSCVGTSTSRHGHRSWHFVARSLIIVCLSSEGGSVGQNINTRDSWLSSDFGSSIKDVSACAIHLCTTSTWAEGLLSKGKVNYVKCAVMGSFFFLFFFFFFYKKQTNVLYRVSRKLS